MQVFGLRKAPAQLGSSQCTEVGSRSRRSAQPRARRRATDAHFPAESRDWTEKERCMCLIAESSDLNDWGPSKQTGCWHFLEIQIGLHFIMTDSSGKLCAAELEHTGSNLRGQSMQVAFCIRDSYDSCARFITRKCLIAGVFITHSNFQVSNCFTRIFRYLGFMFGSLDVYFILRWSKISPFF